MSDVTTVYGGDYDETVLYDQDETVIVSSDTAGPPGTAGATGVSLIVQEGDTTVVAACTTMDFAAADFNVTESPSGEANVALAVTPEVAGTAATTLANHVGALDPHTQYALESSLGTAATTAATDYATAAQGATADAALPKIAAGASVENVGAIESNVNTVAATGATETLDTAVYAVHDVTMDQNCTLTFSNPAPSGKATIFTLILRGAFTPTFPAGVDWPDASAPTYTTPSVYVFTTVDAGTTWLGSQAGKAYG